MPELKTLKFRANPIIVAGEYPIPRFIADFPDPQQGEALALDWFFFDGMCLKNFYKLNTIGGALTGSIVGLTVFAPDNTLSNETCIVAVVSSGAVKFYWKKLNAVSGSFAEVTWGGGGADPGITSSNLWQFASCYNTADAKQYCVGVDGNTGHNPVKIYWDTNTYKWDWNALTVSAANIYPSVVKESGGRLFYNNVNSMNTLYLTAIEDIDGTEPASGGSYTPNIGDPGDAIVGIYPLVGGMAIVKNRTTYMVQGTNWTNIAETVLVEAYPNYGAAYPYSSIQTGYNDTDILLYARGALKQLGNPNPITEKLSKTFNAKTDNTVYVGHNVSRNEIWMGDSNYTYIYAVRGKESGFITRLLQGSSFYANARNDAVRFLFAKTGGTTSYVYYDISSLDADSTRAPIMQTAYVMPPSMTVVQPHSVITYGNSSAAVTFATQYREKYDGTATITTANIAVPGRQRFAGSDSAGEFLFKLTGDSTTIISGIDFDYKIRRRRT